MIAKGRKSSLNWVIVCLFLVFAYLQLNDPDPILWFSIYCLISVFVTLHIFGYNMSRFFLGLAVFLAGYALYLSPSILTWIQEGMPSLYSEMKAETPVIEHVRELGGLIISLVVIVFYWRRS